MAKYQKGSTIKVDVNVTEIIDTSSESSVAYSPSYRVEIPLLGISAIVSENRLDKFTVNAPSNEITTYWVSDVTEYEAGWGQRPDGAVVSKDKNAVIKTIASMESAGSREYFVRCGKPYEAIMTDEGVQLLNKSTASPKVMRFNNTQTHCIRRLT